MQTPFATIDSELNQSSFDHLIDIAIDAQQKLAAIILEKYDLNLLCGGLALAIRIATSKNKNFNQSEYILFENATAEGLHAPNAKKKTLDNLIASASKGVDFTMAISRCLKVPPQDSDFDMLVEDLSYSEECALQLTRYLLAFAYADGLVDPLLKEKINKAYEKAGSSRKTDGGNDIVEPDKDDLEELEGKLIAWFYTNESLYTAEKISEDFDEDTSLIKRALVDLKEQGMVKEIRTFCNPMYKI